jgi:hypothetical protein
MFLFAWNEKQTRSPKLPIRFPVPARAHALRGVLDDAQAAALREVVQAVAVDGEAGEVHGDDRLRARTDRGLGAVEVDEARPRIDVDEHRPGARADDHVGRRDPRERRRDDLVAGLHAGEFEREFERAGAGVHDAHGAPAAELGELRLEALHLRAARDPAGAEHLDDAGDGLFVEGGTGEGQEGGGHGFGFVAIRDRDCRRSAGAPHDRATITTPTMITKIPPARSALTDSPKR